MFENAKESALVLSKELIAETRKYLIDIANGVENGLKEISVQNTRNTNRTFGIIGASSTVVGGIGWICTSAVWPKWLFFAGLAAFGVDLICLRRDKKDISSAKENLQTSIVPLKVRYEIIDNLSNLCSQINKKWDEKLFNWKEALLNDISGSNFSDEQKSNASFKLFYCQNIELSMTKWIHLFESKESPKEIKQLITDFEVYVVGQIEDACRKQCESYKSAENI